MSPCCATASDSNSPFGLVANLTAHLFSCRQVSCLENRCEVLCSSGADEYRAQDTVTVDPFLFTGGRDLVIESKDNIGWKPTLFPQISNLNELHNEEIETMQPQLHYDTVPSYVASIGAPSTLPRAQVHCLLLPECDGLQLRVCSRAADRRVDARNRGRRMKTRSLTDEMCAAVADVLRETNSFMEIELDDL